jgi:hypothetical protein
MDLLGGRGRPLRSRPGYSPKVLLFGRDSREGVVQVRQPCPATTRASTDQQGATPDEGAGNRRRRQPGPGGGTGPGRGRAHAKVLDFRPIDTAHELLQADLRSPTTWHARSTASTRWCMPALHGIHRGHWRPQDFWSINLDGTFNLL